MSSEILRYFQIRKKWENHEYVMPVTADFEFLNEARRRFHGDRFETSTSLAFRRTQRPGLAERVLPTEPDRTVFFDTYLVNGHGLRSLWTVNER